MLLLADLSPVPDHWRGGFATFGNFDGVHAGHARLIRLLKDQARAAGRPAVAVTFDPHPIVCLRPQVAPPSLVWIERKARLLRAAGADEVMVFQTGQWLLDLSAKAFFDRVIREQIDACGIVEGDNFAFGKDRGGDTVQLEQWCRADGIHFSIAESVEVDGQTVSSSLIRRRIEDGLVREAANLLGRPHRIRGMVVEGARRGAKLGFPTANLAEIPVLTPGAGVYACRAWIMPDHKTSYPAAVHIGPNATFGESSKTCEVHLIGFAGDLYGALLEVDFLEFLRGSQKFDSVEELLDQIRADVALARVIAE